MIILLLINRKCHDFWKIIVCAMCYLLCKIILCKKDEEIIQRRRGKWDIQESHGVLSGVSLIDISGT